MSFLPTRTEDEHARITADFMVNGPHMRAKRKTGKNLFKWFKGLSVEFSRLEGFINAMVAGFDLRNSTELLDEWEGAVGIPDLIFPGVGSVTIRQNQALAKLASEGVSTADEFDWLGDIFGLDLTTYPGMHFYDETNPFGQGYTNDARVQFSGTASEAAREARYTVVFEVDFSASSSSMVGDIFPVDFPWDFASNNWNVLQSFLTTLIPSNVNAQYINADLIGYGFGHGEFGHTLFGGTP